MLHNLPAIVVDLERTAKKELGMTIDQLTPSENLLNKKFNQKFDGRMWKATVSTFTKGATSAVDVFTLLYRMGRR